MTDELPKYLSTKIRVDSDTGCWVWIWYLNAYGYGVVSWERVRYLAHRLIYTLLVGEIPEGLHIDHLCRVRACVRSDHLEPVTQAENNRRKGEEIRRQSSVAMELLREIRFRNETEG